MSDSGELDVIYLDNCLSIEDAFCRFDIYAPFVRSLDLYGPSYDYFKISGWWSLIRRNHQHTLLPSLRTLIIQSSCNAHGPDQGMWIQALASPSLVDIGIVPTTFDAGPTVSYPMASFILKSVLELCPNLESLSLFPDANLGDTGQDAESHFLMLLSQEPFYDYLTGLHALRFLCGTTAWFHKKPLGILSRMQNLESLTINDWNDERLEIMDDWLSHEAFSSLWRLALVKLHPYDTSKLLMTQGLVRGLKTLELHLDWNQLNQAINKKEWLRQKIINPLQNITSLTELIINTDPGGTSKDVVEIGASALAIFSQLPLLFVDFAGIKLDDSCLNHNLGTVWPNVIALTIPMQHLTLSTLACFSSLPKLRELHVAIDLRPEVVRINGPQASAFTFRNLKASICGQNHICMGAMELDFVAR